MKERRSQIRMLCADMIEICWKDSSGGVQRSTGLLEDISASGACLQLDGTVPLGTEVWWTTERQTFRGVVRYCVYREIGYFLGVEFVSGSRWSKGDYEPAHLFDPGELVPTG